MTTCPRCESTDLYQHKRPIDAGGAYGPNLLRDLEPGRLSFATLRVVLCANCGNLTLLASEEARRAVVGSSNWERLPSESTR